MIRLEGAVRNLSRIWVVLFACIISACGGGSNGSGSSGTPAPPQDKVTYAASTASTVGQAVSIEPQVSGNATISSWSISPSLPAGLSFSSTSGVISGTPTAVAPAATYTVIATYQGGSASATLSIAVNDVAPAISYAQKSATFAANSPAPTLEPTNSGGAVVSWSVSPALPSGLTLNSKTGTISGTPTSTDAAASYTITAQNSGGSATFQLTVSVGTLVVDLGSGTQSLRMTATRVLSFDGSSLWALWDYAAGKEIASGFASCRPMPAQCSHQAGPPPPQGLEPFIDLEGATLAVETTAGLEVYSATTGSLSTLITTPVTWWVLAKDGSYICGGSKTGLTVWSPSGAVIASRPGDYSSAHVFAAPGQVQVAAGAAGANVIETVVLPSGASSVSSAFQGQFNSWFLDGGRFLSNTGNTVWVYSSAAVQQDLVSFASIQDLGGEGTWLWNCGQNCTELDVYKVGASSTPTATYPVATLTAIVPSGPTIALLPNETRSGVMVDLSGSSPVATNFTSPLPGMSAYAATSASQWVLGADSVLVDGATLSATPRYLGYGRATSIAGSAQTLALAVTSEQVPYFDAGTLAPEGTIAFPATYVALSTDGTVLAAAGDLDDFQYAPSVALNVYSLPSGTQTFSWPYTVGSPPYLEDFTLSGSGTTVGQVIYNPTNTSNPCLRQVTAASGGAVLWSDSFCANNTTSNITFPIRLSPDGTWVAASQTGTVSPPYTTNLYHNGSLVTAVPGWAVGWLDASHILVNNYTLSSPSTGGTNAYINATVYDTTGTKVTDLPIPVELRSLQVVGTGGVYDPSSNAIYSTMTGAATWTGSPSTRVGAVAGANVVAVYGTQAIAVPY